MKVIKGVGPLKHISNGSKTATIGVLSAREPRVPG